MSKQKQARYVGPYNQLRGKTCIVDQGELGGMFGFCWVQFNDLSLVMADQSLAHGWHPIKAQHLREQRP